MNAEFLGEAFGRQQEVYSVNVEGDSSLLARMGDLSKATPPLYSLPFEYDGRFKKIRLSVRLLQDILTQRKQLGSEIETG